MAMNFGIIPKTVRERLALRLGARAVAHRRHAVRIDEGAHDHGGRQRWVFEALRNEPRSDEDLMATPGETHRVARLQSRLIEWLRRSGETDRQFEYAVRRLKRHAGRLPIELLARDANLSRRQLE